MGGNPLDAAAKRVNVIRKNVAGRALSMIEVTGLPSPLLKEILAYIPLTFYPPQLSKEVSEKESTVSEATRNEVVDLLKGVSLDSSCFSVYSVAKDLRHLHVFFAFDKGLFQVEVWIPEEYPECCPQVRYLTPVSHEDVDTTGTPNLTKLMGPWCNGYNISLVLTALRAQLHHGKSKSASKLTQFALWPTSASKSETLSAEDRRYFVPVYEYF
mmetsp:Transcript_10248/g.18686  ORF Transcript_10248/g.18686 Transcript_10248/m.18686 type:complete len:213 (-) Transcript_10248:499-1137(-)|eukprot:CAMPEP_0197521080 /NCGR_PEP_ID=MMETSP1318-20131121/6380_1 /TAXON_ID=552666 /ORGANISM="Partenskyella glossopodia, Strain RCC365" /LENGTH=212 /DNA_ID=CAMNT_0043072907 /DNA_START=276 /DNA_END=914 /DNA_ORIENTATION=-